MNLCSHYFVANHSGRKLSGVVDFRQ